MKSRLRYQQNKNQNNIELRTLRMTLPVKHNACTLHYTILGGAWGPELVALAPSIFDGTEALIFICCGA